MDMMKALEKVKAASAALVAGAALAEGLARQAAEAGAQALARLEATVKAAEERLQEQERQAAELLERLALALGGQAAALEGAATLPAGPLQPPAPEKGPATTVAIAALPAEKPRKAGRKKAVAVAVAKQDGTVAGRRGLGEALAVLGYGTVLPERFQAPAAVDREEAAGMECPCGHVGHELRAFYRPPEGYAAVATCKGCGSEVEF